MTRTIRRWQATLGALTAGALLLGTAGAAGAAPDFRSVRWGMTPAAVEATETAPLVNRQPGVLIYRVRWHGLDAFVSYHFAAGELARAVVNVQAFHPSGAAYVADYRRVQAALTQRYGPPVAEREAHDPSRPLGPGSVWEPALLLGDISRSTRWETERTRVELTLKEVSHYLHFVVQLWRLPPGGGSEGAPPPAQGSTGSP